jgi:lipopolysaccharide export system protein LptA
MRTTQAARYARWSVTVAAMLAVTVAVVYAYRAWEARQAQDSAPPPVPAAVQQRSEEFTFSKVDGNNTRFIVRAAHATEFKEGGRALLEDVWITTFGGRGERADQLHTSACEYFAASGMVNCPDEVLIDLQGNGSAAATDAAGPASGAAHIVTSRLRFSRETGIATSDQPVQFRFPQGEGRAVGLAYDSQRGELHLLRAVEIVLRTDGGAPPPPVTEPPAGAPITISSGELLYRRDEKLIHLNGAAVLRKGRQELQAGQMALELGDDMRARRLVARDQPVLHSPGGDSDVSLSADELEALLEAAGRPERIVASRNVVLNALRPDGRHELTADTSTLDLIADSQQPRHFTASGNVSVHSTLQDNSMRHLQASQLELYFVPASDGDSRLDRVTAAKGTIAWENSSPGSARLAVSQQRNDRSSEAMLLKGELLDGSFDHTGVLRELRGSGGVEVQKRAAGEPPLTSTSRELLALMTPDGQWSTVDQTRDVRLQNAGGDARGDRARFDRAADSVTLTGSVVLTDASSQTRAQSAVFRQSANELRAEGSVATTELPRGSPTAADSEPAHISSARMVADTAGGRATYSGKARLWQGDSVIEADTIELDRSRHTLTATGKAHAVFPVASRTGGQGPSAAGKPRATPSPQTFWQAQAPRMVYEEGQHRARLEQGAYARSADGSIRAERMDLFFAPKAPAGSDKDGSAAPSAFGSSLEGQQVQSAQGFGAVRVESAGRIGTGERADYSAAESKFILSGGHPKLNDEFGNSTAGRQLTFFYADDRIIVDSEEGSRTLTLHRVEK